MLVLLLLAMPAAPQDVCGDSNRYEMRDQARDMRIEFTPGEHDCPVPAVDW